MQLFQPVLRFLAVQWRTLYGVEGWAGECVQARCHAAPGCVFLLIVLPRHGVHAMNFNPHGAARDLRVVATVQGVCGSCWSFSAAQVLASAHFMSTGDFVSLSEQQIMDCSWTYGYGPWHNQACDGGWPELGVQYSIEHGGSFAEKDYPYQGISPTAAGQDPGRSLLPRYHADTSCSRHALQQLVHVIHMVAWPCSRQ